MIAPGDLAWCVLLIAGTLLVLWGALPSYDLTNVRRWLRRIGVALIAISLAGLAL